MKTKLMGLTILLLVFLLAGCQAKQTNTDGTKPTGIVPGGGSDYSSGPPTGSGSQPLSNPDETMLAPTGEALIPWEQVKEYLFSGQVEQVLQFHSRKVILILKNGSRFASVENEIDDILNLIQECGEPCATIAVATE